MPLQQPADISADMVVVEVAVPAHGGTFYDEGYNDSGGGYDRGNGGCSRGDRGEGGYGGGYNCDNELDGGYGGHQGGGSGESTVVLSSGF